ncbi:MAG TPA: hypothetical protein HPP77_05810 [Candidatus Hydrogenedentes bacterium]|nr:hypothetical protein [Candidatus Hydrogenedentota bacterium]
MFRAYLESEQESVEKTSAVLVSLGSLRTADGADLAQELVNRLEESGVSEMTHAASFKAIVTFTWNHDPEGFQRIFEDLVTDPDTPDNMAYDLDAVYSLITNGLPLFELLVELDAHNGAQDLVSLAPLFEEDAPLAELERLAVTDPQKALPETMRLVHDICSRRRYEPGLRLLPVIEAVKDKVRKEHRRFLTFLALALAAASYVKKDCTYRDLSLDEVLRLIGLDLSTAPGYDALLARVRTFPREEAVRSALEQLIDGDGTCGEIHLARMMGDLGYPEFIPALIECLADPKGDFVCESAMKALEKFGALAEEGIIARWSELDNSQRIYSYGILEEVGGEATIQLLLRELATVRSEDLETWCATAECFPDVRLIEALEPELRREIPAADHTFAQLCAVLGHDHARLSALRERVNERDRRSKERLDLFSSSNGLPDDVLPLELKCHLCGDVNRYEVKAVYIDPDHPEEEPYIADELTCRSCGATAEFGITPEGKTPILFGLARVIEALEAGEDIDSPVKIMSVELADGRVVPPRKAIQHYEDALERSPNSVVDLLSLGNCYNTLNRPRRAEKYYRKCVRLEPACAEAALSLAELLDERGAAREALSILDRALKRKKNWTFYRLVNMPRREFVEMFDAVYEYIHQEVYPKSAPPKRRDTAAKDDKRAPNAPCPCGSGKKYKKCCGRIL